MLNEKEYAELSDKVRKMVDTESLLSAEFMDRLIYAVVQTHEKLLSKQRRARQSRVMLEAKARGVRVGRPPMKRPENAAEVLNAYRRGDLSSREAAQRLGVTHKTVTRWAAESGKNVNPAQNTASDTVVHL